jgi:hypothetical protein
MLHESCQMAPKGTVKAVKAVDVKGEVGKPPRLRCKLSTCRDVRGELARLYREGKSGKRDVAEVSRLANVLSILGRLIEGADIELRIEKLEREGHGN